MRPRAGFYTIGFTVALLEEFITQGVLKRNLIVWIVPTFIAFIPFLVAANLIHKLLAKRLPNQHRVELAYYAISGSIGLIVEWFLIGLSPWSAGGAGNPLLTLVFEFGMFSFWGSVAFAPIVVLDRRVMISGLRKWYKRFLTVGFAVIYSVTLASARDVQFAVGIVTVLAVFLLSNIFYFKYIGSFSALPTISAT